MAVLQIGVLIRRRREELGLTQEDLADGICSVPTLSRIENGDRMPAKGNLELLLQRIGYSDLIVDTWSDETEFQLHQLKFQIRQAVILKTTEEGRRLLQDFERCASSASPLNRQFLLLHQTLLYEERYSNSEQLTRLEDAFCLTCPKYALSVLPRVLSYEEIILVNAIAVRYAKAGDRRHAIKLLFQLKDYYVWCAVSIEEILRTKPLILYNLSKMLGLEGRYDECIEICEEGIQLAKETGRCSELPQTLYNCAWSLMKRNQPHDCDKAMMYAKQALHMSEVMGQKNLEQVCCEFLLNNFGEDYCSKSS